MSSDVYVETICGQCNDYAWDPEWVPAPSGFEYVEDVVSASVCRDRFGLVCSVCRTDSTGSGWFTAGIVWVNMG